MEKIEGTFNDINQYNNRGHFIFTSDFSMSFLEWKPLTWTGFVNNKSAKFYQPTKYVSTKMDFDFSEFSYEIEGAIEEIANAAIKKTNSQMD